MYQSERADAIIKILKKYHYVTVDFLVEQICYSPATIRRDLTFLEKQGVVKRSYGGVEIKDDNYTPFRFRQHSMKKEKNSIAHFAASLVKDGDTVFIDGSTSAQFLGHFLEQKKDLTVVTNNMILGIQLKEYGINTYVTGGYISEMPGILAGEITNKTYGMFHADIMFFSTIGFDKNNVYENSETYYQHHQKMFENSSVRVYLCGSNKIGKQGRLVNCAIDELDYVVSDNEIDEEIKNLHPNTKFVCVGN
ncbi:MAG: DeoR/GlpR transcriptional regulator [Clostridia bacterium]|nr:DeoR/GlpR transcriptional regulator [Clostridia bacterium]